MNAPHPSITFSQDWLRTRFAAPRSFAPITTGDGHLFRREGGIRPAAVLVPIVNRDDELTVLFTRRTAHLHDHAGQISFPGGRVDEGDPDRIATALRETEEETGLNRQRVEIIGRLPDFDILTGFRVTPIVGWVEPPFDLTPDPFEVADVFEVPLEFFLDPVNHQRHSDVFNGRTRHFYSMAYGDRYIWGATAGMLYTLYQILTGRS